MKVRAITGFFFIIVMLGSVLLGATVFTTFYLLLSTFCVFEFTGLVSQHAAKPLRSLTIVCACALFAAFALQNYNNSKTWLVLAPVLLSSISIAELYRKNDAPFNNIAYAYLSFVFAVVPFLFFHNMAFVGGMYNFELPLGFLLMLWANDTGAYLVGSKLGRNKLFPRHSPKKSWEGFIGGIVITALVALILSHFYHTLQWYNWTVMGLIISIFGTAGDLIESMFKRSINVKDSGGILPGHGGLLDRFDGLLLAAPIIYAYLYFVTNV